MRILFFDCGIWIGFVGFQRGRGRGRKWRLKKVGGACWIFLVYFLFLGGSYFKTRNLYYKEIKVREIMMMIRIWVC